MRVSRCVSAALLLVAACTGGSDAIPTAPAGASTPAATESASVSSVVHSLRAAGLDVKAAGTLKQPFFSVSAQVFTVDGTDLQIYAFSGADSAAKAAAQVSADGGSIGTTSMAWMAAPHFFRREKLIAISIGGSPKVLAELKRIFGPQFAGRS